MPGVLSLVNPATEEVIAEQALASAADVDAAVAGASAALPAWKAIAPTDRARLLRRFADLVVDHAEELAELETANMGMTIGNSRWCAGTAADVLHYFAGAIDKHTGSTIPVAGGVDLTFHEPLGVVGLIVPWNFPLLMASWKVGPALAAGNTAILKPAETTPLTAVRFGELALAAGIPEGVLQVVVGTGAEAGWRLVEHPDVRKVAFTGSTAVGKRIMAGCAEQVKRVTLELGGKSANIVFADADVDEAAAARPARCSTTPVRTAAPARGSSCSAACSTASSSGSSKPVRRSPSATRWTRPPPWDRLATAAHLAKVRSYTDDLDATWVGSAPSGPGFWHPITVVVDPDPSSPVCREEVFGPVVVVVPFTDEADAVRIANDTPYGLSGSIWTGDVGRALRVARAVEAGALSVNSNSSVRFSTPFGGFKQSGLGREHSMTVLDHYTELKNVFIKT